MTRNLPDEGAQVMALPRTYHAMQATRPIETMPIESAGEAYSRMKSGEARFRMVLTMTEAR